MRTVSNAPRLVLAAMVLLVAAGCGDDEVTKPSTPTGPRTWRVPSEIPTIQGAIDRAGTGDTVLVADGLYHDCTHVDSTGSRSCVVMKSGIYLRSVSLNPFVSIIDAENQGRVVCCVNVDSTATIEGFSLVGGLPWGDDAEPFRDDSGGGMFCSNSSVRISRCIFQNNTAALGGGAYCEFSSPTFLLCAFASNLGTKPDGGGGLYCGNSSPLLTQCIFSTNVTQHLGGGVRLATSSFSTFNNCTFLENEAGYGSGVYCLGASMAADSCTFAGNGVADLGGGICFGSASGTLRHCTFYANEAAEGGAVYVDVSNVTVENSILSFSAGGGAVYVEDAASTPTLSCCDIFGNTGGDWTGLIASQYGHSGNILLDPLFCDAATGDFRLQPDSPCAPNGTCGLIGAWGVGCGKE